MPARENYGSDTRRRSTRSAARLLRFFPVFTIAQSNVLSNAYLTVHRIGHTRVAAIAWRVIGRFADFSKRRRHRITRAAVRQNLLLFQISPPGRPNFPSTRNRFSATRHSLSPDTGHLPAKLPFPAFPQLENFLRGESAESF